MTDAHKIRDIGPISIEIEDGDQHPSGFGDMKGKGVLFHIVASVMSLSARDGQSANLATAAYEGERRDSWAILEKVEGALKSSGYEFQNGEGQDRRAPRAGHAALQHVVVDNHVAWLQVAKFPSAYALSGNETQDQLRDRLKQDVAAALDRIPPKAPPGARQVTTR